MPPIRSLPRETAAAPRPLPTLPPEVSGGYAPPPPTVQPPVVVPSADPMGRGGGVPFGGRKPPQAGGGFGDAGFRGRPVVDPGILPGAAPGPRPFRGPGLRARPKSPQKPYDGLMQGLQGAMTDLSGTPALLGRPAVGGPGPADSWRQGRGSRYDVGPQAMRGLKTARRGLY
jgi:hypothetical protein